MRGHAATTSGDGTKRKKEMKRVGSYKQQNSAASRDTKLATGQSVQAFSFS